MRFRLLLPFASVLCAIVTISLAEGTDSPDAIKLAMNGGRLSDEEAASLEKQIEKNPRDIVSRTKLLGYYFRSQFQDQAARESKQTHVLWLIRNRPEATILATPYGQLSALLEQEAYAEGKKAWEDNLNSKPTDLKILENSSNYFMMHDRELAKRSLQKARKLDDKNPKWPNSLGHLFSLDLMRLTAKARTDAATQALDQFEIAYDLSAKLERETILVHLAKVAFEANQFDKAKEYAKKTLEGKKTDWNHGNRVHHGHLILGRIALAKDDVEEAKKRLLKAGKTPGSPQLNSFGPNMKLAKQLLQKGEKDVVLKYFRLCSQFWMSGRDRLKQWAEKVQAGEIPQFGANLRY